MSLNPAATLQAADLLIATRRSRKVLDALPEGLRPSTMAEGYVIQDQVRARWGSPVAGWKVGATAAPVQAKFGVMEPFAGPFFADGVVASPGRIPAAAYHHKVIESEFAFRVGHTLAPRPTGYARDAVIEAIDAVIPAFEIVSPRFTDLLFGRAPTAAADCAVNGGMVFGKPLTDWRKLDLPHHAVRLDVDGKTVAEGTGANVLGDPVTVLVWLVGHLGQRGIALDAGQIISTGTTTGIVTLTPGQIARADFGSLGQIEMTFTA